MVRRVTFGNDQQVADEVPPMELGPEPEMPAQPGTPARRQQLPPRPRQPGTPEQEVPAGPPAGGRPARVRKTPAWLQDYELNEMTEMSEFR